MMKDFAIVVFLQLLMTSGIVIGGYFLAVQNNTIQKNQIIIYDTLINERTNSQ